MRTLFASILTLAACAESPIIDSPDGSDAQDSKADSATSLELGRNEAIEPTAIPSGSYRNANPSRAGMISVFEIDGAAYRRLTVGGASEEDGVVQYSTNEWGDTLVSFLDENGYPRDTLQVGQAPTELLLIDPTKTQHFYKSTSVSCVTMGGVCVWSGAQYPSFCESEWGTEPVAGICGDYSLICCNP